MDLNEFTATNVAPGEPITAQAWNELVEGIRELNDFVAASQATSLRLTLTNTDIDLSQVLVLAERDDGWVAAANLNSDGEFVFTSLPAGAFTVSASATGFNPASQGVSVPTEDVLSMTLSSTGAFMPNIMGLELSTALAILADQGIAVGRLLDVVGRELAPAKPDPEYQLQPVLVQLPDPGVHVAAGGQVSLVVSTALQVDDSVEVPPLTGLTQIEARKALEAIGLRLGKVEIRERS